MKIWLTILALLSFLTGDAMAQFNGCPPGFCNKGRSLAVIQ